MQTRRHVLTSISALAVAPASQAKTTEPDIQSDIAKIVAAMERQDGAQWSAHVEADFILIHRKL